MKRCIAGIFFLVILFQSFSSLYIYASFYLNRDYISKNVCINRFDQIPVCKGQCHLDKQISENEKQEQKFPDLKQKEMQLFCQEQDLLSNPAIIETADTKRVPRNQSIYSSNFYASVFHPPQIG